MLLQLQPSRIEFGIVFGCHFCALLALFSAELNTLLALLAVFPILASMLAYCFQNSSLGISCGSWKGRAKRGLHSLFRPRLSLMLGQQHGVLRCASQEVTVRLPRISYYSEFLIVLSFAPELPLTATGLSRYRLAGSGNVAIWPDSLSRVEDRQLRRYLRFECPRLTA